MENVWLYLLAGVAGGMLGGMGLGGGTLLIPLLTMWLCVSREGAAWLNLISFLPMSVVALVIHAKRKMVSWRDVLSVAPVATAFAVLSAFFAGKVSPGILRISFGCFLIAAGAICLVVFLVSRYKKRKEKCDK